jgi:2-(1,2-epoxy-1,2-dihydrophenyl)acetyl-CoA isomerase
MPREYQTILVDRADGIVTITLNRPDALNALDLVMREELAETLYTIRDDPEIKAVVLTGAGRAFCAGGDIKSMGGYTVVTGRARIKKAHRWLLELVNLEKPTIAAVNGVTAGIGCNLALACDIIYASDQARFSQAFVKIGLVPDGGGMYFLPRAVGLQRAKELVFTGDFIEAQEAERIGLVARVMPHAELHARVSDLARRITQNAPVAVSLAKGVLNKSLNVDLPTLLEMEALAAASCIATADHEEGVRAFVEKRRARFTGK